MVLDATAPALDAPTPAPPPLGQPDDDRTEHRIDLALLYGPFLVFSALTFCFSPEDPFITLRYAANLDHGLGAVFNAGQHVEGYTSPLHLLLVAVVYLVPGGHALLKVKLLSLGFGVLTVGAGGRLALLAGLPRWGTRVAFVLIGGSWALAVASANGLETTLTCWLVTLLAIELVSGRAVEKPLVAALVAAGLVAARPEGIAMAIPLGVVALVLEPRAVPWMRRCAWVAGAVLAQIVILAARLAYYGQLLPNTYYAKHEPLGAALSGGLLYLSRLAPGVPWFVSALEGLVVLVGAVAVVRARRRWLYALVAVLVEVLAILATGGDWMIGDRFLAPLVPIASVLTAAGVVTLVRTSQGRLGSSSRAVHVSLCGLVATIVLLFAVLPVMREHDPVWSSSGSFDDASLIASGGYGQLSTVIWPTGLAFLQCVPSGSLVAYSEDGYAAFERLDLRFLDLRGLNDATIAHESPAGYKSPVGVADMEWASPHSVVGTQIRRLRPTVVLDPIFDNLMPDAYFLLRNGYVQRRTPAARWVQSLELKVFVRTSATRTLSSCSVTGPIRAAQGGPAPGSASARPSPAN